MRVVTGFHAIEEALRSVGEESSGNDFRIVYCRPGPRVKKIIAVASAQSIRVEEASVETLDTLASSLPVIARDHRGIVLVIENAEPRTQLSAEDCIRELAQKESALVLILDSITDPHNVGAIIRSADQFGVDLVILPENRGATDFGVISRTSAGAASWVRIAPAKNLVRAVDQLKDAGFWVYGADAVGNPAHELPFPKKTVLIMGSEGSGLARLLKERCDAIVSIPTHGKLDSLNVSVAAGILLYEIRRPIRE